MNLRVGAGIQDTMWDALRLVLMALVVASGVMTLTWVLARRVDNASVVDAVWAGLFGVVAPLLVWAGGAWTPRQLILCAMVMAWSARLAWHLAVRIASHHPVEDGRYIQLRAEWAPHVWRRFFIFFQNQALSVVVLSTPMILVTLNQDPNVGGWEWAGLVLFVLALWGEAVSDAQLRRFKRRGDAKGRPCDVGWWRYSRHPNYFFEWMVWVAVAVFASGSPWGFVAWACPAVMFYLVVYVTGIPLTEQQALRSRGDTYRRYQQTVSAFVPWFPRSPAR